ncbi:hypothetical protein SKAU_G00305970 [Synaphobranchus kaupii]|uniref:Non-muscle caldesmon n=1 Tax=Synaphobranchus kaupii TaxID=118154 RepID=A0A9Q1EQR7_SYNKA|nr:hypothetical protein SKAU_G00305970 [Synaphobranchus kaupii]
MSSAIVRRNSSKEGLQNLLRITAQRSIEDAEEIERERRRRARESFRSTSSQPGSPQDGGTAAEDGQLESELKPSCQQAVEEDEGFSDWTQKLERRRQRRLEEQSQTEEEEDEEQRRRRRGPSSGGRPRPPGELEEEEEDEEWKRKSMRGRDEEEEEGKLRVDERMKAVKREEEPVRARDEMAKEKRKEVKVSYTSKVFLSQEMKHINGNGDAAGEEVTSHLVKTKRQLRSGSYSGAQEGGEEEPEAEVFLEKIRRTHQEKEVQELEQLRQRQVESEAELEELNRRREERRKIREEEERRREEEEYQRQLKDEEEKRHMKEEIERRRMEATERRMKNLSTSSIEGEEPFSPLSPKSPSFKGEGGRQRDGGAPLIRLLSGPSLSTDLLRRATALRRRRPPLLTTRIDNKLEQYSHAVEEAKLSKQGVVDIPSPTEPVASKKTLFEAGEAWNQNSPKTAPSKDTEGLKVGVADLITQWVKGSPDGSSRNPASKPADIKAGDVLHKKNMWESIRDSSTTSGSGSGGKGTPSGKRYKFVVTGHGKYEKIPVDDGEYDAYEDGNSKSPGRPQME